MCLINNEPRAGHWAGAVQLALFVGRSMRLASTRAALLTCFKIEVRFRGMRKAES